MAMQRSLTEISSILTIGAGASRSRVASDLKQMEVGTPYDWDNLKGSDPDKIGSDRHALHRGVEKAARNLGYLVIFKAHADMVQVTVLEKDSPWPGCLYVGRQGQSWTGRKGPRAQATPPIVEEHIHETISRLAEEMAD